MSRGERLGRARINVGRLLLLCHSSITPPLHYSSGLCHLLFNVHKIRVNSDNKR